MGESTTMRRSKENSSRWRGRSRRRGGGGDYRCYHYKSKVRAYFSIVPQHHTLPEYLVEYTMISERIVYYSTV